MYAAQDPGDPTWGEGEKTSRLRRRRLRTIVERAALRVAFCQCAEDAELGGKGAACKQRDVGHFGSPRRGYLKGLAVWGRRSNFRYGCSHQV